RTYVNRYAVRPGSRALVVTTNDTAYEAAVDLVRSGIEVVAVLDTRPRPPPAVAEHAAAHGIQVLPGHAVTGTGGEERIRSARIALLDGAARREVACDLLLVSGGWSPAVHLFSQAGGRLRYDPTCTAFVPEPAADALQVVGRARGERRGAAPHALWVIPPPD